MIVARVASAAEAILKDYSDTGILNLLQQAIQTSASRQNISDQQYPSQINALKNEAKKIIDNDITKLFPKDIAELLRSSGYSSALPGNIARVIYTGLSTSKTATMSSSEFTVYQEAANSLRSELSNMLMSFKKLNFDAISVPDQMVSIDILIPRDSVENDIYYFLTVNRAFADIVVAFQQLMGLPKEAPKLVYSSTTDLVTGITIAVLALTPFLNFYNKLLEAAQKHLDIRLSLKNLKSLPLKVEQDFTEQAEESRKNLIETAIEQSIKEANSPLEDKGLVSELSNLITIRSKIAINAITNGARIGITLESLVSLPQSITDQDTIRTLIKENAKLGSAVSNSQNVLGEPVALSITDESGKE